ncbi:MULTISPECIES: helix-turn-helix domain-containing protein [unclassified Streptomyces]|uniref:AraC family transcriptional regulator n=1 Tax=unclassified Streptomyces TaxID=2593676 RepID=UPI00117F1DDC|nr:MULTISPECIES: helix-turn-helix domain-containing protein [unclassified Streptomyces]TRO59656.1 AraC family transcriptional regulator [Streptomyces sp. IB201691-2A2]
MTNDVAERALPAPDALRPWIDGIEIGAVVGSNSDSDGGESREPFTRVPDTATKVVVRVDENGHRDTLVVGPRTRATYHTSKRLASCVQVRLGPGTARPLLGVAAVELVGRVVRLGDLPGSSARQLAGELRWLEGEDAVGRLMEVLPGRLAADDGAGRSRREVLRAAVEALSTDVERVPSQVRELAARLAVSERQLRNLFAEGVGVSPKHFARIGRVRHVLAHAGTTGWAELAASTGYYDQSHMTADFRTLMGVPPRSFFTGRLPVAQPCQSLGRV